MRPGTVPVEAIERLRNPGQLDVFQITRLDGNLADLLAKLDPFLCVVRIKHALVIPCSVGKEAAIGGRGPETARGLQGCFSSPESAITSNQPKISAIREGDEEPRKPMVDGQGNEKVPDPKGAKKTAFETAFIADPDLSLAC